MEVHRKTTTGSPPLAKISNQHPGAEASASPEGHLGYSIPQWMVLLTFTNPPRVGTVISGVEMRGLERGLPAHDLGSGTAGPETQAWSVPGPRSTATLHC